MAENKSVPGHLLSSSYYLRSALERLPLVQENIRKKLGFSLYKVILCSFTPSVLGWTTGIGILNFLRTLFKLKSIRKGLSLQPAQHACLETFRM